MIKDICSKNRKSNEKRHSAKIAQSAVDVWGWGTPAGQRRAIRRAALLIQHGAISSGKKILEIGCGTGSFTQYFAAQGARVVAIDLSQELLVQLANSKHKDICPTLGDAEYLPFCSDTFDSVVGSSILHHLEPRRTLAELYRVLRRGGYIAFAEPNMLNPQIMLQKNIPIIKKKMGDSPDEAAFFRWQISHLLQDAGFKNVEVRPFDFLHPLVPASLVDTIDKMGYCLESTPLIREIAGSLIIQGRKR